MNDPFNRYSERAEALASQIYLHKKLYYSGKAVIPDEAFDALEDELRKLAPNHPALFYVGSEVEGSNKVTHNPPMLSLAKTYDCADVAKFISAGDVFFSEKLDGMALALEYGSSGAFCSASTRGNGTIGENVTEKVRHILSIPKQLNADSKFLMLLQEGYSVEIRGEVYFPVSAFSKFEEQFDSFRNAIPGTFGRKDISAAVDVLRVLKFRSYELLLKDAKGNKLKAAEMMAILELGSTSCYKKLSWLEQLGFDAGIAAGSSILLESKFADDKQKIDEFLENQFRKERDFQIDGFVFRIDNDEIWESLGVTSHHPRGSLAFKKTGDTATTKILDIQTNIGRSGKLCFRAQLDPVFLSGAKITYATLHNAEFVRSGGYAPGAVVRIKRSGEVIPSIIGLEDPAPIDFRPPETCPCGYPLEQNGPDLYCVQQNPCPHKDYEGLVYFAATIGLVGVSEKTIRKLREAGLLETPADFFRLKKEDLMQIEGFAEKSAENLIAAVWAKKQVTLALFLASLGLKRGGIVKCQEVARHFKNLSAVLNAKAEDFLELKGWAEKSARDFVDSLVLRSEWIQDLLKYQIVSEDNSALLLDQQVIAHVLFGKNICITGALSQPRNAFKEKLEQVGAKLVSSVSGKTDFLICNEPSDSGKYLQAQSLGVPILSENELLKMLGI